MTLKKLYIDFKNRHVYFLISMFCLPLISFSQHSEINKLKFGGSFGMENERYSPKKDYYQFYYDESVDSTEYCCSQNRIKKYIDFIKEKSKRCIINRTGNEFYNTLKFQDFSVIYHNYNDIKNFDSIKYDIDKCGNVNYWLTYSFFADSITEYGFGIELDSKGNCVSKIKIPVKSENNSFRNILPFHQISEIAKQNFDYKSIESIKLEYCENTDTFCWLITTKNYKPQVQIEIGENEFKAIDNIYEKELIFINVQTGKIISRKKEYMAVEI